MAVSDYLQKSSGTCRYSYSKLKDVLYLVSYEHLKDVQIDNGEAYISGLTELPLRINGFNIQFNEETSLDERYKFQKTLTLSMHGYVNYKIFGGRYYAIIEDVEGTFYMINVDFPSRITHTFNLAKDTNQTDFTFSSLSNFPTLKLNAEFEAVSPVCLGLNVYGIEKLQLIEKEKARLDTVNKTVISTEDFKTIEFLGNSCSFQEVYDGFKVTDTIQFNIALDNYKPSWQYNLLEFLDNRYSAIITPRGNDNKYYPGYNFGLQPSYTIQTASNPNESDIITITLVETSSQGSTAAVDWKDEQSTETRWRWVKRVGDTICYECIGLGRARYLVRQEVDLFGNPTGNYQVMEGYESQYPNFHVVATFTTQEIFETSECSEDETCQIETTIPSTIYFNAITCNTYSLQTSCDWSFANIPDNIIVEPMTGVANSSYTVSICNTLSPSATAVENSMRLNCCKTSRVVNFKTQIDAGCIKPQRQYINCMSQDVVFTFDGGCIIEITSIDPRLTYSIGYNTLTVRVPRNYGTSAITWSIIAVNCDCSSASTVAYINQDKTYERWVEEDGYMCESGNSYHIERRYTGSTEDSMNTRTDEIRTGSLIQSGDTRCETSQTKWEWDGESYYCVDGNKFKAVFEYISYDGGINWVKTGNTRLGDMVEASSEWCNLPVTYSWVLTSRYECSGTTSYYLYQKYEQRGEQDPIPAYPNYWSIDGDGTQTLSKKMDNDPSCGYVPPVEPIYSWAVKDANEYWCEDYNKYQKLYKRISYDGGLTWQWVLPYETMKGTLIQEASTDCGYVANFTRWVNNGTECDGFDLYHREIKQTSYDNITWHSTTETRRGELIEINSRSCGYIPPSEYQYRWVDTGEFTCESGDTLPITYLWMDSLTETICEGYIKRRLRIRYYNTGDGWVDSGERMPGEVLETFSTDCDPTYTDERLYDTGNRICSGGTVCKMFLKQIKVGDDWIYKYPFEYSFTRLSAICNNCYKLETTTVGHAVSMPSSEECSGLTPGEWSTVVKTLECDGNFELTKEDVENSRSNCVRIGTEPYSGGMTETHIGNSIGVINSWFGVNDVYLSNGLSVIYDGIKYENGQFTKLQYNGLVYVKESTEGLKNVIIITDKSVEYCNDTNNNVVMGNKVEIIGRDTSKYTNNLVLPSSVKFISSYAFEGITLNNGIISNGVVGVLDMSACTHIKRIEMGTFKYNHITSIVFPPNLETIDNDAFSESYSLSSVTMPNGVKYIGDGAFHLSPCLTNIVIPSSVEYIGEEAFYLTRTAIEEELGTAGEFERHIYVYAEIPPKLADVNSILLYNGISTRRTVQKIHVPISSINKYKEAPNWKYFKNEIYGIQ